MKTKKAATILFKPLLTDMLTKKKLTLTEEELISVTPQFKNLTLEKRAKLIEFVYELSL